jgi:hypothetical protein
MQAAACQPGAAMSRPPPPPAIGPPTHTPPQPPPAASKPGSPLCKHARGARGHPTPATRGPSTHRVMTSLSGVMRSLTKSTSRVVTMPSSRPPTSPVSVMQALVKPRAV